MQNMKIQSRLHEPKGTLISAKSLDEGAEKLFRLCLKLRAVRLFLRVNGEPEIN